MNIDPQEIIRRFPEWKVCKDGHGFYVYTKTDFQGCIRQNSVNGAAEVFGKPAEDIIANPLQSDPWFIEYDKPEYGGHEAFEKAVLFIDIISNA